MTEIKFCGMTRPEDAALAASLGATYVGVIFAGGPRQLSESAALRIFDALPKGVRRVGVFDREKAPLIAARATRLDLNVIQLHGDPRAADIRALRSVWANGEIWAVVRVAGAELPSHIAELFDVADAVLLDAKAPGMLGGTGVTLPWQSLANTIAPLRKRSARLVLAGGLRAENVAAAIRALAPQVVDVSSGVESAVGIKDPIRMRAFRDAVHSAESDL